MGCAFQTNRLSKERIKRLTRIGFVWHLIEETYRRGIEETRRYKKEYGTPNCPSQYITAEGYRLGQWRSKIKMGRKRGTLTPETIRELEALGFDWQRS
ncbi:MAG: hypothetical protein DMG06_24675 [Acidobacteria bacterium]|nr:MAG: hypothetical protein DMG06_24675 [Acidobacteriota bacterium]